MQRRVGYHSLFLFYFLSHSLLGHATSLSCSSTNCAAPNYPKTYFELGIGQVLHQQFSHDAQQAIYFTEGSVNKTLSMRPTRYSTLPNHLLLGMGSQWTRNNPLAPFPAWSVGLRYQYSSTNRAKEWMNFSLIGIEDGAVQPFLRALIPASLIYQTLTSDFKVNLYRLGHVSPYVNFGVGVSWKRIPSQAFLLNQPAHSPIRDITSNWQSSSLSYRLGAGLDFLTSPHFTLTLGYEYDNFGAMEMGAPRFNPQTQPASLPKGVKLSNFYLGKLTTHRFQLSGRYFFG